MRLKHLELQGYKTFAAKTEFVFDSGITAIVGPNGSGKSNIADAVRWVLGEQSYKLLRAKRTEDMIFSGSAQRPRLGMAQVTITLDNSDGQLPVDFTEVSIGRRAYRSGENEYLLNGQRVRLQDINELLSTCGLSRRTYTVIGQGLVDAVLSLRPEERRTLFEEAAGITGYQSKRKDALNKLEQTRQNLLRVQDIINEITPRLKRLQTQATRAEEHRRLSQELQEIQRVWYGYQWHQARQALRQAQETARQRRALLRERREALESILQEIAELRTHQAQRRQELSQWHRQSSALHAQAEARQRELAVADERRRLLLQQREELQRELLPLIARRDHLATRIAAAQEKLQQLRQQHEQQLAALREAEARLEAHLAARRALEEELQDVEARLLRCNTDLTDRHTRLEHIGERRREIEQAREEHRQAMQTLRGQLAALAQEQARGQQAIAALEEQIQALKEARARTAQEIAACQETQTRLREEMSRARREEDRRQARYDLLTRLRSEGEGLYAGVQAVLQARQKGKLSGIVGVVAELIQVAPELETAFEVALGSHLQDVVVEKWSHAQAAIAYLKDTRAGRATFLPLDTVRPPRRLTPPATPGVLGVGSDLVQCSMGARHSIGTTPSTTVPLSGRATQSAKHPAGNASPLRPIAELLLNRTLVVQDLPAARRAFQQLSGGFQIVTLGGEVVRSGGAVTGGTQRQKRAGLLAREREWRELPAQLQELARRREALGKKLRAEEERERQLRLEAEKQEAQWQELEEARREQQGKLRDLEGQVARLEQEITWREELIAQGEAELQELQEREVTLRQEIAKLDDEAAQARQRIAALREQLAAYPDDLRAEVSRRRTEAAVSEEQWQGQQALLDRLQGEATALTEQIAAKEQRAAELAAEAESLTERLAELRQEQETLSQQLAALQARLEPAEAELREWEERQQALEEEAAHQRTLVREYEEHYNQAQLLVERRREELKSLRRQIEEDLGLVEVEMGEALAGQPPLPLRPLVTSLPQVTELPEGLTEEMRRLKARLRRLEPINPNAPAEYKEARERHDFLTSQAADLEQAAQHLRQVIAELDQVMEREFQRTFKAVAREFRHYFTRLFNGGSARLVLTDPDQPMESGIEVIARPPGKRTRSLSLLSGGERALTAAALIFAILKTSPTPFCILDEVDAMLDEANVGRFREVLEELAQDTQFIVITHNRGTIEAAHTIYGVTMGEDSVSQVLSLKP